MQIRQADVQFCGSGEGVGGQIRHGLFEQAEAGAIVADLRMHDCLFPRSFKAASAVQDLCKGVDKQIAYAQTEQGNEKINLWPSKSVAFDGLQSVGWYESKPGLNFKCLPAIPTSGRSDAWV
jgi:hypothetical protein